MDFFIPILNTLALAVAFILLIIGLMSAPWQVLLLILVLGLLAYQWLVQRHHLQSEMRDISSSLAADAGDSQLQETTLVAESSSNQALQYRGSSYTASAAEPVPEAPHSTVEVTGQYRGGVRKFSI